MAWTSADLYDKFLLRLGRGNGGVMAADELWTPTRVWDFLADAQEAVYADMAPMAPHIFVGPPTLLTSADGGVTYTFSSTFPFAHVEVYAQESGGRELFATTYGNTGGDFVIEGTKIRAPGNKTRTYQSGPWARFTAMPARLSASVEPSLTPAESRELILFKALAFGADVSMGALDPTIWEGRYREARMRWATVFQTQYASMGTVSRSGFSGPWYLTLDAWNGA